MYSNVFKKKLKHQPNSLRLKTYKTHPYQACLPSTKALIPQTPTRPLIPFKHKRQTLPQKHLLNKYESFWLLGQQQVNCCLILPVPWVGIWDNKGALGTYLCWPCGTGTKVLVAGGWSLGRTRSAGSDPSQTSNLLWWNRQEGHVF